MILPCYAGEAVHHLRDGSVMRFRPTGPMYLHGNGKSASSAREEIEDFGEGGPLAARLILGLNVGTKATYSPKEAMSMVYKIRKDQKAPGDVSVLAQLGIYEDSKGRKIEEKSVQILILDLSGEAAFVEHMKALGEELRLRMKQERVIIEIQKSGVVQHVYSATDPKLVAK